MKIRTKEKCPLCGGRFVDIGWTFICPKRECLTHPKYYYIEICWKGKQYRLYSSSRGKGFKTFDSVKEEFKRIEDRIAERSFDPEDYQKNREIHFSFEHYAVKWVEQCRTKLDQNIIAPLTYKASERYTRLYFIPHFKKSDIRDINNSDITDFWHDLPASLKINTQKNILRWLHTLFSYARQRQDIFYLPVFPKIKAEDSFMPILNTETIKKIYNRVRPAYKPVILFLWKQGCRPAEARSLQIEDINQHNKTITIRRSYSGNVYRAKTKNKKIRIIPIHPLVWETLKKITKKEGFIFLTPQNKPISHSTIRRVWLKAVTACDLPHCPPYTLRHSFCSRAINAGVSKKLVMEFLGTTVSNYIHISPVGLQACLEED